jgi:hypothetical protein
MSTLIHMPSAIAQITRFFDRHEDGLAFLPWHPELLDFDLAENKLDEICEIIDYYAAFGIDVR